MINDAEITFVVQGSQYYVNGYNRTVLAINSIRKFYPKSKIIFSTSDTKVDGDIEADIIVQIDDVGSIPLKDGKPINTNRQLASTKAGLERATTKWVCKTRSDVIFRNRADFVNILKKYNFSHDGIPKLVSNYKIIVSSINTKIFNINDRYVNHVSDWFYFGELNDLKSLFALPLLDVNGLERDQIMSAERYIWESFARKHLDFRQTLKWGEMFLVGNAIVIDPKDLGIRSLKMGYRFPFGVNGYHGMRHGDWLDLYCKYNHIPMNFRNINLAGRKIKRLYYWLRQHLLINPLIKIKHYFFD